MLQLPKDNASIWRKSAKKAHYLPLSSDLEVDVAIVGAGITGLTAAYLLKKAGFKVAVLEKRTIGSGTTGRTTGKVTSQHNLNYADLYQQAGKEITRTYGEANQEGIHQIEKIIKKEKIKCDWQRDDNYVYGARPFTVKSLKREADAAKLLGLPAEFVKTTPLPFYVKGAVKFTSQAKFHSLDYLKGLAKAVNNNGSFVYEKSPVIGIRDGTPCRVRTRGGRVFAKHVIVATNVPTLPLLARGSYCFLEYPMESYIVAGKPAVSIKGMYISPEKRLYSILPIELGNENWLLVGGESNISGLRISKEAKWQRLANFAEEYFGVSRIEYKWSDRDYLAYDGLPLVGKLYPWSKNVYVATAYKKWGLANATAAAMILTDTIKGEKNPWAFAFDSTRTRPLVHIPKTVVSQTKRILS